MSTSLSTAALIDALVVSTGGTDAVAAIRIKAANALAQYRAAFGEPAIPVNVEALASFLGIPISDQAPVHSKDAELEPLVDGRVAIRVNADRPETRRRFSIGHEISHTFFPNYQTKTWCRTDARHRRRDDPDQFVELLCDVGAAELLMPSSRFTEDSSRVTTGSGLVQLAKKYGVSREAMLRRFAENHPKFVAALFMSWKLKPTQHTTIGQLNQPRLFGDPAEEARRAKRLRIDYSILSGAFAKSGHYVPNDKSIQSEGPLYEAASTGQPCEGTCHLDIGTAAGEYRVLAVPTWTPDAELGPDGENGVAAIIQPLDVQRHTRKEKRADRTLFE